MPASTACPRSRSTSSDAPEPAHEARDPPTRLGQDDVDGDEGQNQHPKVRPAQGELGLGRECGDHGLRDLIQQRHRSARRPPQSALDEARGKVPQHGACRHPEAQGPGQPQDQSPHGGSDQRRNQPAPGLGAAQEPPSVQRKAPAAVQGPGRAAVQAGPARRWRERPTQAAAGAGTNAAARRRRPSLSGSAASRTSGGGPAGPVLRTDRRQPQRLPGLHAAPIPLELAGRVAQVQQGLDVGRRLAAPGAVTE